MFDPTSFLNGEITFDLRASLVDYDNASSLWDFQVWRRLFVVNYFLTCFIEAESLRQIIGIVDGQNGMTEEELVEARDALKEQVVC